MRLLDEQRKQSGVQTHRSEQVGSDDGFRISEIRRLEVFGAHDAGIVDDDVERWILGRQPRRQGLDAADVIDVELQRPHAGILRHDAFELRPAAAGDDDLVAERVKRFGQPAADAGAAAGDQNGVAGHVHGGAPLGVDRGPRC